MYLERNRNGGPRKFIGPRIFACTWWPKGSEAGLENFCGQRTATADTKYRSTEEITKERLYGDSIYFL